MKNKTVREEKLNGLRVKFGLGVILSFLISILAGNFLEGLINNYFFGDGIIYLETFITVIVGLILIEILLSKLVVDNNQIRISQEAEESSNANQANTIKKIKEEVSDLSIYSQELSASSKEGSTEIKEAHDLIEDMIDSIQDISASAEEVTSFAQEATSQTQLGKDNIEKTINSMRDINQAVDETMEIMQELNENSQEIGEIIELITDIADQTNLLALNAAIEAARAGEEGQGFAVVAEEIRELAEETANATGDIVKIVEATQTKSKEGLEAIKQVNGKAKEGENIAEETDQVFSEIETVSQQTAQMIEQTAISAQDLADNSEKVRENSENISEIFEVVIDSSHDLAEMSKNVDALVSDSDVESGEDLDLIKWDDSYSIGVDEIDEQHQELFRRINDLIMASKSNTGKDEIKETLDFLADYTVKHFADEEELQKEYDYPDYETHKDIHEKFVQDVVDFQKKIDEEGMNSVTLMKFNRKATEWLVNHVKGIDQEVGAHINKK